MEHTTTAKRTYKFSLEEKILPQLSYLGYAGFILAVVVFKSNIIASLLIFSISCLILYAFRRTKVRLDLNKRKLSFCAGLWDHRTVRFSKIDQLLLSDQKMSQTMSSRGSSHVIRYTLYRAHALIDGEKVLIAESRDQEWLLIQIEKIANSEQAEIRLV